MAEPAFITDHQIIVAKIKLLKSKWIKRKVDLLVLIYKRQTIDEACTKGEALSVGLERRCATLVRFASEDAG